jgi:hypothetical protein
MYQLTSEEREHWEIEGYLHLKNVLDANQISVLTNEMDRMRGLPGFEPDNNPELPIGHYAWLDHAKDSDPNGFMDRRDLLPFHPAFVDLIDASPVFEYVVDIMGVNILLSMTQAIARPVTTKFPGYTHTDGGESLRQTRVAESSPPIAMKALFLLTDDKEPDQGNLTVFPGSHRRQIPTEHRVMTPYSPGATQLMGDAGDVILFSHALWHGPAQNLSHRTRKILLYNYCQLWVRSYDHEVTPDLAQRCTPRQRRLLGELGYDFRPGSYFYVPKDQDEVIRGPIR